MKIIIAGNIILDVINEIQKYPKKGLLETISKMKYSVGGAVSNTGITLKRLDNSIDVIPLGRIGNDQYGSFIIDTFKSNGLSLEKIIIDSKNQTSFTQVMSEIGGQRTFFYYGASNDHLNYDDIMTGGLKSDFFHLGYALLLKWFENKNDSFGNEFAHLMHDVKASGIKTSLDIVSSPSPRFNEIVVPALKYLDNIIINEIEAQMISGINSRDANGKIIVSNVIESATIIKKYGVSDRVIIHSPEISICYQDDVTIRKSLKLSDDYIVGTTGAGDAFCAGCLYGIMSNYSNKDILDLAAACAACNLSVSNSIDGARSLEDTLKIRDLYKCEE